MISRLSYKNDKIIANKFNSKTFSAFIYLLETIATLLSGKHIGVSLGNRKTIKLLADIIANVF